MQEIRQQNSNFQSRVWIATAILAFMVVLLLIIKTTFSVLLLVFAGILLALFLQGVAGLFRKYFKSSDNWAIGLSIGITFLITAAIFFLIGAKIQAQASELIEVIPQTFSAAKEQLNQSSTGQTIVDKATSNGTLKKLQGFGGQFFTSTFGVLGDVYVILFIGLFIAVAPKIYSDGALLLVPRQGKPKAEEVIERLGTQLRGWLKGKLFAMLVVGVLTAIGLAALGIKLWLVLAILAGLISFIPNFGPVIALIPAVLIALLDSAQTALYVTALYVLVQFLESNFITPLVQQKLISLPPALILTFQLIMGALTGGWGLVLATPIAVVLMVVIQKLYIERQSDDDVETETTIEL